MVDSMPKVFVSYSWTSAERVLSLVDRLFSHGVEVIFDKYILKEGQDKYAFMEQCVTDESVNRVLIICDKTYADKANSRTGGVGDETAIISSEIYGKTNQEKFIPVIFERDDEGSPYCPAYIKNRIYIDLSTDDEKYETEYEKLLRNIYDKPTLKKPALGVKPEWLENDSINLSNEVELIKQIASCQNIDKTKILTLSKKFETMYIQKLLEYWTLEVDEDKMLPLISEMKGIRDIYLDYLDALILQDEAKGDRLASFLEFIFNSIFSINTCNKYIAEVYEFYLMELFICTTAFLFYYEAFQGLSNLLNHTYFLRQYWGDSRIVPCDFTRFRFACEIIEYKCKPKCQTPNLYTLTGKLISERERKPIYTSKSIVDADILLFQLCPIVKPESDSYWFPTSYIYKKETDSQWIKLSSKKYCEKFFPLFGVESIEELKTKILESSKDERQLNMRYRNCFTSAPNILHSVALDDIGAYN